MEEKNRASQMLSQMKKYLQTEKDAQAPEKSDAPDPAPAPVSNVNEVKPVKEQKPKPILPTEESLFEFDDVIFDDVLPERPALTPEEAVYAEELSEKFGLSRDAGVSFLDDTPAQDGEVALAPAVAEDDAAEEGVAPEPEDECDLGEPEIENIEPETAETESQSQEQTFDEPESVVAEVGDSTEPAQVTFGGIDEAVRETVKASTVKTSGIQLTFLDSDVSDEVDFDDDAEQMVFGEYEDEYDNIDEDEDFIPDDEEDEEEPESIEQTVEVSEALDESVAEETSNDATPEEEIQPEPIEQEVELTPIEINAIEEAERARAEAEMQAASAVTEEPVAQNQKADVWNDEDRAEYEEKKRFFEFCSQLEVPELKVAKETKTAVSGARLSTSGYKYEMNERLPLFPDGMSGGRYTESYVAREIAYCEDREQKRSAQLLDRLRFASRRLVCSFVILITVLLIENLNVFFGSKPDGLLLGNYGRAFSIAVAVLLTIGAGLVFDSIRDGLKYAFKGVFIPEVFTAGVAIPSIVYHLVIAFAASGSKYSMLFGTGAAAVMLLCGLYRYNMLRRAQIAFSVTSSYGEYITEVRMVGFKDLPEGRAFDGYADPESSLYRLNRLSRVDATYDDVPVLDECFGLIRRICLLLILGAVVAGVAFGFFYKDAFYGILSAISLITYGAPAGVFIALSVPRVRAAAVSAEYGGAIVDFDDESDEFDAGVIMIDEQELFPPELLISSGFDVQRSPGIEIHLSRTLALFKKIGGSLAAMFSSVEGTIQSFESVIITEITSDGISAKIDGVSISAGTESYMKRLGIRIKRSDKLLPKNGRVMYIADNGEFFARATLLFKADEELVHKMSELRNTETLFSIKTCNPCIDQDLVFHATGLEPELLKLVKYEAGDMIRPAKTDREGSLVSKNGAFGLLTALLEYKRQKKLFSESCRFACISCAVGVITSLITSAVKINFGFSALLMIGVHGALSLAAFLISRSGAINTKSKIKKK